MIDLKGQVFGYLTAKEYLKGGKWKCLCKCGNETTVETNLLTRGSTSSCGCYKKLALKLRREKGENPDRVDAILRRIYVQVKTRHTNKLRFRSEEIIPYEEWRKLVFKPCVYCGRKPFRERYDTKSDTVIKVNGLDRIDSNKGYLLNNVVPCCWDCNIAKSDMTLNQFIEFVSRLTNNLENIKNLQEVCSK